MRAFDIAATLPWAIVEANLRAILEIAARENLSLEAVEAQLGRKLDNTRSVKVRDGVAIIPITGPIFRRASLFSDISGAVSVSTLACDLTTALHDPAVHSIIFDVDSPGGEVTGVNEFADIIYAARGRKPMVAYVDGLGCSAAYWIASAADEIVADATSALGSIGVVLTVRNPGANPGPARDIEFVSTQSPDKRPDPTSERGRSQIQQTVDALGDVFVAAVARNRGVSEEKVLSDFGQGGILVGRAAVEAGLADRLGSFEGVLAELVDRHNKQRPGGAYRRAAMPNQLSAADEQLQKDLVVGTAASHEATDIERRLAELEARNAKLQENLVREQAKGWANSLVATGQLFPAEHAAAVELFVAAALDDAANPRPIAFAGATMSRVDLLKHQAAQRPAHQLGQELVPVAPADASQQPDADSKNSKAQKPQISAERRAEILSKTPTGRAILAAERRAARAAAQQ